MVSRPTTDGQEKELSAIEKGEEGERAVNALLGKMEPEYRLIKDVHLRTYENTTPKQDSTQIDHILLSIYGIFVIETKNWTHISHGGKSSPDNPTKQNEWHLKVLAERLEIDVDNLFSIVVFAGEATIPKKLEGVCYKKNLEHYIRSNFKKELFTRKQIESFYTTIQAQNLRIHDPNYKAKHDEFCQIRSNIRDGKARNNKTKKASTQKTSPDNKFIEAKSDHSKKSRNLIGYGSLAIFMALLLGVLVHVLFQPQSRNVEVVQPHKNIEPDENIAVFRQQLAQYESDIEPKIEELQLNNWAAEKYTELKQLKIRAVEDFAKGAYLPARASLQQAHIMITELSAEYVRRLLTLKREANAAFANNRTAEAEKAIRQALLMSPEDAEMHALQQRVAVLPQVLDLLTQATVAEHENRPEKEIVALQKVLALDPSRHQVKARLEKLQRQLKQQQFSRALGKAQRALDAGDLARATKQIALAKTLFPASNALAPLQNQLQQARIENEFAKQTALAEQAKKSDDWKLATQHFAHARKLKPTDKTVIENHNLAQQVADVTQQISRRLIAEHRLADETIATNTVAYLREVEPLVTLSKRLQKAHTALTHKVNLYNAEVDVVVVSDNKTYIVVRGQGQVGKILRHTIRLRPGKRVFEGSRSGYKSKLVTVDIKPETSVTVTVICDEKI